MTREEKIAKLSQIRVLVTNPVMTYDMGVQFDVITDKGALTDVGNIGQWPFLRSGVSEKLRTIQQKLIHNEVVSDEEFDDDDICREICTYHEFLEDDWALSGEQKQEAMSQIKAGLQTVDLQGNDLFVFASLEEWNTEIRLFTSVEDLYGFIILKYNWVTPYSEMDDEEIDYWYDVATENNWGGLMLNEF